MARLEDTGNTGLPRPPAPPRRGANPWHLSATAQKAEPQPQAADSQLLEELMKHAQGEETHAPEETPLPAPARRPRSAIPFLMFVIFAGLIAYRFFADGLPVGGWISKLWPLIVVAFIAHGWWQARQRREAARQKSLHAGESGR